MEKVMYEGYGIYAIPYRLAESKEWAIKVVISRDKGYEIVERQFSAGNTFKTKEEALEQSIIFGKRIIDGEVENFSVADL